MVESDVLETSAVGVELASKIYRGSGIGNGLEVLVDDARPDWLLHLQCNGNSQETF